MIFAIIDIGSHTLRLAIYERKNGADSLLTKTKFALGLAGYLKNNVMAEDGILSLLALLKKFCKFISAFEISRIYAFATAAIRMSENQAEILGRIKKETGLSVKVISGEEEASLAFSGATQDSPIADGVLFDIGGGSCEIVKFADNNIIEKYSMPIGAVSLSKKFDAEFFPNFESRERIKQTVKETIEASGANFKATRALGLGGAAKAAKLLLNRDNNDSISKTELDELLNRFTGKLTNNDKSLLLRSVADRMHILITGFVMLSTLMDVFGTEKFYYRNGGVREGFIDKYID